jgi:hypothetical protein
MGRRKLTDADRADFTAFLIQVGLLTLVGGFTPPTFAGLIVAFSYRLAIPPLEVAQVVDYVADHIDPKVAEEAYAAVKRYLNQAYPLVKEFFIKQGASPEALAEVERQEMVDEAHRRETDPEAIATRYLAIAGEEEEEVES